jgi:hypothetical protein
MSSQGIGVTVKGRGVLPPDAFRRILEASPSPRKAPKGCTGHFFDPVSMKIIKVDLGYVYCRPIALYRAAPSRGFAASLSGCEGVAPCEELSPAASDFFDAGCRSTSVPAEKSGSYVIPGLLLTSEQNQC